MAFDYDQKYLDKHFSGGFYRWQMDVMRNRFIRKRIERRKKGGNFLEIGFGNDSLFRRLGNKYKVYGIDISEFAVDSMQKKYGTQNFVVCDISRAKIPFECRFDVICSINTIEHLEDYEFGLTNIRDALKPDGIFVVHLPTCSNPISHYQYEQFYNVPEHVYRPSYRELTETFKALGFQKLEQFAASFFPFKINHPFILNSMNLYFGIFQKTSPFVWRVGAVSNRESPMNMSFPSNRESSLFFLAGIMLFLITGIYLRRQMQPHPDARALSRER
jgi:SAM-dependent methyltransferase